MKTGIQLIAEERERQVSREQWSDTHDDLNHSDGSLAHAAEAYLREIRYRPMRSGKLGRIPSSPWPWNDSWWKPTPDKVRQLVKAGALIAAEIDRLQRLTAGETP